MDSNTGSTRIALTGAEVKVTEGHVLTGEQTVIGGNMCVTVKQTEEITEAEKLVMEVCSGSSQCCRRDGEREREGRGGREGGRRVCVCSRGGGMWMVQRGCAEINQRCVA